MGLRCFAGNRGLGEAQAMGQGEKTAMSTRHARRPVGASRTTYIRNAQSGRIGDRSNASDHRLPPSGVPRLLLWLLAATIALAVVNYLWRSFG